MSCALRKWAAAAPPSLPSMCSPSARRRPPQTYLPPGPPSSPSQRFPKAKQRKTPRACMHACIEGVLMQRWAAQRGFPIRVMRWTTGTYCGRSVCPPPQLRTNMHACLHAFNLHRHITAACHTMSWDEDKWRAVEVCARAQGKPYAKPGRAVLPKHFWIYGVVRARFRLSRHGKSCDVGEDMDGAMPERHRLPLRFDGFSARWGRGAPCQE